MPVPEPIIQWTTLSDAEDQFRNPQKCQFRNPFDSGQLIEVTCLLLIYYLFLATHIANTHDYCFKETSVGINTEWGLLMASISEDTGEETPLQFFLSFFLGTVEWGCNVYRFRGTHSGCTCSSCPDGQVTIVVVAVPERLPLAVTLT
ncbi:hypothetical protein RHGRI_011342 [Rhododendron griersonianum]|uniref:Uncharacterized protein n=1 Tax=Rhododendron griersonianum TaxID=479676 RepID=A0AAV6KLR0_9ERIC|nr:hypothetical protein RHGRI_011342 [Rhododendron griersonianum]